MYQRARPSQFPKKPVTYQAAIRHPAPDRPTSIWGLLHHNLGNPADAEAHRRAPERAETALAYFNLGVVLRIDRKKVAISPYQEASNIPDFLRHCNLAQLYGARLEARRLGVRPIG
jgi:hypothetical protein